MFKNSWRLLSLISFIVILGAGMTWAADPYGARGGVYGGPAPIPDPKDLAEGFTDITTLPGAGWVQTNLSSPLGSLSWFQGNSSVFPAHAGAPTAYIAANYNSTGSVGTISNWLLTPVLNLNNLQSLSFYTRTATGSTWADRLEVRMSTNGASSNVGTTATDVGDFSTLLLSVNPSLAASGYPQTWTQFTVSSVTAPGTGRIAFRYFVTNGGSSGSNSNYIGIDTFQFTESTEPPIPSVNLLGAALIVLLLAGAGIIILRR